MNVAGQATPRQVIVNAVCDSRRWDRVQLRGGDIIIVTPGKSGTTWTQQIVGQLLFEGEEGIHVLGSPCPDHTIEPEVEALRRLEAMKGRRFIKSHLPIEALPYDPSVKYIFVGRDIRDILWSAHAQLSSLTGVALRLYNRRKDRVGPPIVRPPDVRKFYQTFLATGETPTFANGRGPWSLWDHYRGWWEAREFPNVLLVHFNQLKADLAGSIRTIAEFLGIHVEESKFPSILEHCGIDYMRAEACRIATLGILFEAGGASLVNKGTNGRWKDILRAEEIAMCDDQAIERLGVDCARWITTGQGAYEAAASEVP
jgi:aryl sulfotransferase